MNTFVDLLDRSLPILLGAGAVQLAIALLKRRAESRLNHASAGKAEAEASAVVISSAERSLALADRARDRAEARAEEHLADLLEHVDRLAAMSRKLATALGEVEALHQQVAELKGIIDALRREVSRLRAGGDHPAGI